MVPGNYDLFNHWIIGKVIDPAWLDPVTSSVNSALTVVLPIGFVILGVMSGINYLPKLLKRLSKG